MFVLIFGAIILLLLYFLMKDNKEYFARLAIWITICFGIMALYVPVKCTGFLYKDHDKVIPYENNRENFIKIDDNKKGFTYTYEGYDSKEDKVVVKEKYIKLQSEDIFEVIQADVDECKLTVFVNKSIPSMWTFGINRPQYRYVFTLPYDEKLSELETCEEKLNYLEEENINL